MNYKKMSKGLKTYFLVLLAIVFTLLFPKTVFAVSISAPSGIPSEVQIDQLFNVSGSLIDVLSGQTYFVKCRIGLSESNLNEGQTYNSLTGVWLSDSGSDGAWVDMPTVVASGSPASFSIQCKVKPGVSAGQKLIYLRGCLKESDGTCKQSFQSSNGVNFLVLEVPTPIPSLTPILTSSPTPTPTSTLTPTPVQKAVYTINKAKDNNGGELSYVDIYVDDVYIGHRDNEILNFCDGCHCDPDKNVDCNFGQHKISMKKDGYQDWQDTRTFNLGDSDVTVDPVLAIIVPSSTPTPTTTIVPTSTPTPTIKPSLTPTKTPTPTISLSLTATPSGEVLGEEIASRSGLSQLSDEESKVSTSNEGENKRNLIFPAVAAVLGLAFIGFSIFSFLKGRRPKEEQAEVVV